MAKDQRTLQQLLQGVVSALFPGNEMPQPLTVNMADSSGDTPLHVYARRNDEWAVRVLIKSGADPNAVGDMGETPLHVAAKVASAQTLAAILAAGARDNMVSEFGQTPVHVAEDRRRASVYRKAMRLAQEAKRGHG